MVPDLEIVWKNARKIHSKNIQEIGSKNVRKIVYSGLRM